MDLTDLGWTDFFDNRFPTIERPDIAPMRVMRQEREQYLLIGTAGELLATIAGRLRNTAQSRSDFPAVGDWVVATPFAEQGTAVIHAVFPRKSAFSRKVAGTRTDEQILAANIDTAFIVNGLDGDFNLRRIERYITLAWESDANPVVILNKADITDDVDTHMAEAESVAMGVPVLALSALENDGLDQLDPYLSRGDTVAFLGSSGVGKSTLVNRLLNEERMATQDVRADDSRGRHTTTHRELIILPSGALVIDTPGMRELQLWGDGDSLSESFADIESLAENCRFRDCTHGPEPSCAVQAALDDGTLDEDRYQSYLKLQRELAYIARRQDEAARRKERNRWKEITVKMRQHSKHDPKRKWRDSEY